MTENELLEALRTAVAEVDQGALRVEEMCEMLDVSGDTVRRRLRPLIGAGKVVRVRKVIVDMGGRRIGVNAYRAA